MNINVKTSQGSYDIILERGAMRRIGELLELDRKVLVVTDSGVPSDYPKAVLDAAKEGYLLSFPQGETSKQMETYRIILEAAVKNGLTRTDCIVAVGGGVVGDMAGFVAATYMRGIDFYNVPTTLLSQVDSSVGGKTAIDFMGLKNIVGAFYPPRRVVIDPDTLKTLPKRHIANGLAEAVKMSLTSDEKFFEFFEDEDIEGDEFFDCVIERSVMIKKSVVEADEREGGLRKILNFGHTVAHAIESVNGMGNLYHGECVAIGMLLMCDDEVKARLKKVLEKLGLPTKAGIPADRLVEACRHDKKASGDRITLVTVPKAGSFEMEQVTADEFEKMLKRVVII